MAWQLQLYLQSQCHNKGISTQPKACRQYEMRYILECQVGAEAHVDDQGLNVSTDHHYLGASKDGRYTVPNVKMA